jgi:uncharacterized protein
MRNILDVMGPQIKHYAALLFRISVLLLSLCLFSVPSVADTPVPALSARVVDQTDTLDAPTRQRLETTLSALEQTKGAQLVVLIVASTKPETIEQYGLHVAEQWKLGRKGVDDGALLLIAKEDRAIRIEVGYGLEGAIPDVMGKRIIEEIIAPHFRSGDFTGGVVAGVDAMVGLVQGEALPEPKRKAGEHLGGDSVFPGLMMFIFIVGGVIRAIFGRLVGAVIAAVIAFIGAWLLMGGLFLSLLASVIAFVFTLMSGFGRGINRGAGGFGGGGLGGGGGGFSGGGGGFGGGGASGRW